jgi:hypothetical protein
LDGNQFGQRTPRRWGWSLARCRYSSGARLLPWNRSWPRRLRAVTEIGSRALRSKGRRAGAERRNGAQRIAERRPECSGAQPNLRRKRGASGGPKLPSVTSVNAMQRIDHRRRGMGPARGRDAEWRSVGHGGLTDRIEHGDSPACSVPIPVRKAHCLLSGVALFPVVHNRVAGAGEPFLVATKLFQDSRWEDSIVT